jgi:hypothetical protein
VHDRDDEHLRRAVAGAPIDALLEAQVGRVALQFRGVVDVVQVEQAARQRGVAGGTTPSRS